MQKKRRKSPDLKEALAKLRAKSQGEQVQFVSAPTRHSSSDVKKARKVLDRLLALPTNEVSSIRIVPRTLQEREDSDGV